MQRSSSDRVGPYELLELVGSGGMGEVWRARDVRLGRVVAIKFLKGQHGERFAREARAVAALNHPNICQIYDIGPEYLVLEYVDGKPLRGPYDTPEALRLALQIAAALEEAHAQGILHRDLKPQNILVNANGIVKLLDFGVAKFVWPDEFDLNHTAGNVIVGTTSYMSPEQVQGKLLDERSDIFSFGAVLYEMMSGRRAFSGGSPVEVLTAILRDKPRLVEVPDALAEVVTRCLSKDPEERFRTAAQLRLALEAVRFSSDSAGHQSIAILPFANMSGSIDDDYFCDGLAEEIINLLSRIPELKVTARTSSFAFRGKEQDITEIACKLRVRTILEGSVRRAGGRIRVTVQLINGGDGFHMWSESYDRGITDLFSMQDEIAVAVTQALRMKLAATASGKRYQPKLPAYEAFLKARHLLSTNLSEGLNRGRKYLEQAIALDPQYAEPYAELAHHCILLAAYTIRPVTEVLPLARAMATKARQLDPCASRVYAELAVVAAVLDFDWESADEYVKRAMRVPTLTPEWRYRCAYWILVPQGRFEEAIREVEIALEQDPLSGLFQTMLSLILAYAGRYERAVVEARKALELDPTMWLALSAILIAYAGRGMFEEARESADKAVQLAPWNITVVSGLAGIYSRLGDQDRANDLLSQCKDNPGAFWLYHLLREEFEAAIDGFEEAIDAHEPGVLALVSSELVKPLRMSARWVEIERKLKLTRVPRIEESWLDETQLTPDPNAPFEH